MIFPLWGNIIIRNIEEAGHLLHDVHVATSKQDVEIERGVNNLNFDKDCFSPEFNEEILKDPFRRGWLSIISSQSDGGWYYHGGANIFPYIFGHDACGSTFINDAMVNYDVPSFNRYLESD